MTVTEQAVREWRAREAAAFALYPIMDREGLGACAAGELADAAVRTYLRVCAEPLPEGWQRHVTDTDRATHDLRRVHNAYLANQRKMAGTMNDNPTTIQTMAEKHTRSLAEQGKLIEAGWQTYRLLCLKTPPHESRDDLREAFLAGAEHAFSSMITMLDPGQDETEGDLRRMDRLHAELEPIRKTLTLKYGRTAGSA
jgi:hypothetical protein